MTNTIKVTTTSTFEGVEITDYLEPITAHVVVGMNMFKDILASFTDVFGGKSNTYQNTLSNINEEVLNLLREKAKRIGANCILGLKIDNDEISSQGKSMLMVTAVGTAAIANFPNRPQINSVSNIASESSNSRREDIQDTFSQDDLMEQYGITFENEKFVFSGYRYENLIDAVNYAKSFSKK